MQLLKFEHFTSKQ